jgi:hypothetical protein
MVQEKEVVVKLNWTHQLLVYPDYVHLLSDNIYATNKNIETLIDTSREMGIKVNTEKT